MLAGFAALGFGLPRSHAAPLGEYTTAGAYTYLSAPSLHPPKITGGPASAGAKLPGDIMIANFYDLTQQPMVGQSGPEILGGDLQPIWFKPVSTERRRLQPRGPDLRGQAGARLVAGRSATATGQINSGEDIIVNQHYQKIATIKGRTAGS